MVSRVEKNKKERNKIIRKEKIKSTTSIAKIILRIVLIVLVMAGIVYVSGRYIGTLGLMVKEYSLEYDNLPENFYGLKVIHISDINFNNKDVTMKKVKKLVKKVNEIRPDIIVFTGSLLNVDITNDEAKSLIYSLNEMEAKLGKYTVFGDNDDDKSKTILKDSGFIDLSNNYDLIYDKDYKPILINGISSDQAMDIPKSFAYFDSENAQEDIFTITLMHKPDNIDKVLAFHDTDLVLAGHSLNGLVKLPMLGGVFTYNGSRKYFKEYTRVNDTDLFISGGVGTRQFTYRLFNHPSINLYRLR